MRGKDGQQLDVLSYISPEQLVPHDHPRAQKLAISIRSRREGVQGASMPSAGAQIGNFPALRSVSSIANGLKLSPSILHTELR